MVSAIEPEPGEAILLEENVAVTPAGIPVTVRETGAFIEVAVEVTVVCADLPSSKVTDVDEAASAIDAAGAEPSAQ
jgi:hypothetical protein